MARGSNNPFGVKALPGEPHVTTQTWEEDRFGRRHKVQARFRKYVSITEAIVDHARLLQGSKFARARAAKSSAEFADALTGVYATDHKYGSKLKTIMKLNNLEKYDKR